MPRSDELQAKQEVTYGGPQSVVAENSLSPLVVKGLLISLRLNSSHLARSIIYAGIYAG